MTAPPERYALLEHLPLAFALVNAGGDTLWMNRAARELLGADGVGDADLRVEQTGEPCPAEQLPQTLALRGESVTTSDLFVRSPAGDVVLEVSAAPVAEGAFLSFRDITQRRAAQDELARARDEALEAARVKSEFLANVSHEVRTPLNGVLGSTGLLLGTPLTPEQRDFAEMIRSSGETLLSIVNDVLDLSRVEAGKLTIETIDFNLDDLLESVVEQFAARAAGKRLKFSATAPPDVPRWLRGDSHRIRQVLLNLAGNAIKFTERGEVSLTVMALTQDETGTRLRFLVRDSGIGIASETQQLLFTPFMQADGSTTRRYGGSGLGLAVSKQLVMAMGGDIGVISALDEGSTFWFELPLLRQETVTVEPPRVWDLSSYHALLVDSSEVQRELVQRHLATTKLDVTEAVSAAEGLALASSRKFDLILFDMQLVDDDGLAFARSIRADSEHAETRLLLITAFGRRRHDLVAFRNAGIDAFVIKPIRRAQLCDSAARLLVGDDRPAIVIPPEQPHTGARARVLVVEDNNINQLVILGQLERLGHSARVAVNGADALRTLDEQSFDLILMDCQMPDMDGYEATRQIRRRSDGASTTPVVAVTAHALSGERERCLAAGMNDYVVKPVSMEQLGAVIRLWTSKTSERVEGEPVLDDTALEVLDRERVGSFLAISRATEGFLDGLVRAFRQDVPSRLDALRVAVASSDGEELALAAHALKSSSGSVGAKRMLALASAIETAARSERFDEASTRIEEVAHEYSRVLRAYDGIIRRSSGGHVAVSGPPASS